MAGPQPGQHGLYFMISPSPKEVPEGVIDPVAAPPGVAWGRMFYVKFGDGDWHTHRYTTNNPCFTPSHTDHTAKVGSDGDVGSIKYYFDPVTKTPVDPGTYLKKAVLTRFNSLIPINGSEWFRVHLPNNSSKTIDDLKTALLHISTQLDDQSHDFGLAAATDAWRQGVQLSGQRMRATAKLEEWATDFKTALQPFV